MRRKKLNAGWLLLLVAGLLMLGCPNPDDGTTETGTPPDAPTTLAATAAAGQVTLTWAYPDSAGITGAEVVYGTSALDKTYAVPFTTGAAAPTSAVVTDLVNGSTYTFKVRSRNAAAWSGYSNEVSATPAVPVVKPAAPAVTFDTAKMGKGELYVQWEPVQGAVNYNVKYSATNDEAGATALSVSGSTDIATPSALITGLELGTTYYVWVRAGNTAGWSDWTTTSQSTIGVPAKPANVMAHPSNKQVRISWDAYPDSNAGITKFVVSYGVDFAEFDKSAEALGDSTELAIKELTNDLPYQFRVQAVNIAGVSEWSDVVKATPATAKAPPEAPATVTITPHEEGLSVKWSTVDGALRYKLKYGTSANPTEAVAGEEVMTLSSVISGLQGNTQYYVWVSAVNEFNNETEGPAKLATGKTAAALDLSLSFPAWYGSIGQVRVHWTAAPSNAAYYTVGRGLTDDYASSTKITVEAPATDSLYQITSLNTANTYYVWVTAYDAENNPVSMRAGGSTNNVPHFGFDARTRGTLAVKWSEVEGATGYELKQSDTDDFANASPVTEGVSSRAVTLTGVADNALFYFWVRANTTDGSGSWSKGWARSQYAPVGQQDSPYPEYTPSPSAPSTDKISVAQGFHPEFSPATVTSGPSMVKRNSLYLLTEESSPLVALGYKIGTTRQEIKDLPANAGINLDSNAGKPWFDTVILFNAGFRDRDCLNDTASVDGVVTYGDVDRFNVNGKPDNHQCTRQGLHLHIGNSLQYVLDNRETYIKPLQDAGIKVLISILGDWSGVNGSVFGDWPYEDVSPIAGPGHPGVTRGGPGSAPPERFTLDGKPYYPYHNAARDAFLMDVKNILNRYQLDGIDIDDEWYNRSRKEYDVARPNGGSTWIYSTQPSVYSYYQGESGSKTSANAYARQGKNMAQFVIALREAIGPNRIIHLYEYGMFLQSNYMHRTVPHPYTGEMVSLYDYYDYSTASVWPSYVSNSGMGTVNENYGPMAYDMTQTTRVRPAMTGNNPVVLGSNYSNIRAVLSGGYGWTTCYGIYDRYRYNGGMRDSAVGQPTLVFTESKGGFFNRGTSGTEKNQPEMYLSMMSEILYGAPVVYDGEPNGYGPWMNRGTQPWNLPRIQSDVE